ncbi:MAG: tetratricopeptide repeat protein [Candidatus Omnitrophota bacterium]
MKQFNLLMKVINLLLMFGFVFVMATQGSAFQLSQADLELWKDPVFQKQFTMSYIAETDIEPRVATNERDQMIKILDLISSDKLDEAVRLLEKNRGDAANAVFDFTLANIYFQQDKLEEAAELYTKAVDKYPKFRRAWRNLGVIYIRQHKFQEALPALSKVVELGGGDAITYGLLGFAYSSVDNHLSAESAYRMAILVDPQTLDWKMGLARGLFKQKKYADAVSLCEELIKTYPDREDLWLLQANAFIGLNQPLKAAENYELVDRLGKSTVDSLNMLGDIYINEKLYELAVNSYKKAIEKSSDAKLDRAISAAKILVAHSAFKETRQLIEVIEKVQGEKLKTDQRKDLLKLRARLAVAEGSGDEEARILEEIVEIDPLDGEALILLGQYSNRAGNMEKAIFYFERAASIEKFEADAKLRHAQVLVANGKYKEAVPLLRRVQTLNPREDVEKYLAQVERVAKGS